MKFLIFINIVTFVLVSLKYQHNNDELQNKINKFLENGGIYDIILLRRTHRILSKYENQIELMNSSFHYETPDNGGNHKLVNKRDNNNTYEQLERAKPNNMEAYFNSFKYRNSKKVGLKKLDYYYEKKIFTSIDKIEKLAKQKNLNNRRIKKILFKKYVIPLIIISLIPLLTLAIPGIKVGKVHAKRGFLTCISFEKMEKEVKVKLYNHKKCKFDPIIDNYLKYIFLFISTIIVLSIIIYTYIKILKYKRIKAGMLK